MEVFSFWMAQQNRSNYLTCERMGKKSKIADTCTRLLQHSECHEISSNGARIIPELQSAQEEADTRMMIHIHHAKQQGWDQIIVQTPDTNVFVISLSVTDQVGASLFFSTGVKNKKGVIDLNGVKDLITQRFLPDEFTTDEFLSVLLGVCSYTGCDTVSAFTGKGKVKAINLVPKEKRFVELFASLGRS